MPHEEPAVEPLLEHVCEVCATDLTDREIETAREAGRPFVCTLHATEELPAVEPDEGLEAGRPDAPAEGV